MLLRNVGKIVSSTNGAGKTGQLHVKKNEVRSFFDIIYKNNLNMGKDLNVRPLKLEKYKQNTL